MISILLLLFGAYFICILVLMFGFFKVPKFHSKMVTPITRFSIVIPFRNESKNLDSLLASISDLKYPSHLFEIIFVNDFSKDNSEEIILKAKVASSFSMQLLQNKRISKAPKKEAISEAINNATYEWILTTDADCELPKKWLQTLDAFIQNYEESDFENSIKMICGPICYASNSSFLQEFQFLDALSLQAVTVGSFGLGNPILCNGANLAYRKDAFKKVNGFSGNNHVASGDDIFLMEKFKKQFPKQVKFLKSKEAIVFTKPQFSWKHAIVQRIRWASKTSKQKNSFSILLGLLVFFVNLTILIFPILFIILPKHWILYIFLLYFKILIDFIVVRQTGEFFHKPISFWKFQWMPFFYAAITVLVFFGSIRGNYSWKGRNY